MGKQFTFEERDDGFLAVRAGDGRSICHVEMRDVTHSDFVDGDPKKPKLAAPQKQIKQRDREKWLLHFTGVRLTPGEVKAFLDELPGV